VARGVNAFLLNECNFVISTMVGLGRLTPYLPKKSYHEIL